MGHVGIEVCFFFFLFLFFSDQLLTIQFAIQNKQTNKKEEVQESMFKRFGLFDVSKQFVLWDKTFECLSPQL